MNLYSSSRSKREGRRCDRISIAPVCIEEENAFCLKEFFRKFLFVIELIPLEIDEFDFDLVLEKKKKQTKEIH